MKAISDETLLAGKVPEVEARLEQLEREVAEIGMPAGIGLKRRLERLRIEARALRRNLDEAPPRGGHDGVRRARIEALLRHIEREEAAVGHEADFLHQAAPSSVAIVAEAGARVVDLYRQGVRKVLGGRHPLGESVFVNRTHKDLEDGAPR
jgi:hypothetical protein